MENKKDKNNEIKSAKRAIKSWYYKDFEKVAEKLKKEGKLNEKNYKKILKGKSISNSSFLFLLVFLIVVGFSLTSNIKINIIVAAVGLAGLLLLRFLDKRSVNRLCYLYTFGKKTEGEIIGIRKETQYRCSGYNYYATFKFYGENGKAVIMEYDIPVFQEFFFKISKATKIEVPNFYVKRQVYYNPKNHYDAIVDCSDWGFIPNYNLLLTTKNK